MFGFEVPKFRTQNTGVMQMLPLSMKAPPTFEDLKSIEKNRRDTLKEAKKFIGWHFLYAFQGTVLPGVFSTGLFWITMFSYIAIRIARVGFTTEVPALQAQAIAVIGGFMSFFLTFFVNQNYSRFCTMYGNSMAIEGRLHNLCLIGRNHLPTDELWRFVRYINAAHMLGYVGLSPTYNTKNFVYPINETQKMLLPTELARLEEIGLSGGGAATREVLGWALEIIYRNKLTPMTEDLMVKELLSLRGCIGTLFDFEDQPLPYAYMHLLLIVTSVYLPILSYGTATNMVGSRVATEIITGALIALNAIFVIGMREVGRLLMDPYNEEVTGLSVMHYVNSTFMQNRRLLTGRMVPPEDLDTERKLEETRPNKGNGFLPGAMVATVYSPKTARGKGEFDNERPSPLSRASTLGAAKLAKLSPAEVEIELARQAQQLQDQDKRYAALGTEEV